MGLNIKLLTAPLTNRVHLGTIVGTAVLFGIIRLSGGGIALKSRTDVLGGSESTTAVERASSASRGAEKASSSELEEILNDSGGPGDLDPQAQIKRLSGGAQRSGAGPRLPARTASGESESLEGLVDVKERAPAPKAPARSRDSGGLNDIEKLVGLR